MSKTYKAISEFLDGKQKRIALNDEIKSDDYDEVTINHYLNNKFIEPVKATKKATGSKKNKAVKPIKNK